MHHLSEAKTLPFYTRQCQPTKQELAAVAGGGGTRLPSGEAELRSGGSSNSSAIFFPSNIFRHTAISSQRPKPARSTTCVSETFHATSHSILLRHRPSSEHE